MNSNGASPRARGAQRHARSEVVRPPVDAAFWRQAAYFEHAPPLLHAFLDALPGLVCVLNGQRRIVYANRALRGESAGTVPGRRPGEALRCLNASAPGGGCGGSAPCAACGIRAAIAQAEEGRAASGEGRVPRASRAEGLDLRVWAAPLRERGEQFTVLAALDMGDEQRRRAMDRLFFHDVSNAVTGLRGYIELLADAPAEEWSEMRGEMERLARRLAVEIRVRNALLAAECNEICAHTEPVMSRRVLEDLSRDYAAHPLAVGRRIVVDSRSRDVRVRTDRLLLRRILECMLTNALEACPPGGTVTMGCGAAGRRVEWRVRNPGRMTRSAQRHVFRPDFSTKGPGRGLGAYRMKMLGERCLKGRVSFTTSSRGTIFRLRCPAEPVASPRANGRARSGGRARRQDAGPAGGDPRQFCSSGVSRVRPGSGRVRRPSG